MLKRLLSGGGAKRAGYADRTTDALWTTPWAWRDTDHCYIGWDRSAWLYRELPLSPLVWEDPSRQVDIGAQLANLLYELADTARDRAGGISAMTSRREIHLLSVSWESAAEVPAATPPALEDFLRSTLPATVTGKTLLIGVKLRSAVTEAVFNAATRQSGEATTARKRLGGLGGQVKEVLTSALGEDVPDLSNFAADRAVVEQIFSRTGVRTPTGSALDQLESWYNNGLGPDITVYESKDFLRVDGGDRIELAAVMRFERPVMQAPESPWLLDAMTSSESPAHIVSVRGELEPATVARNRARQAQRRIISQVAEEAETGDLSRVEDAQTFQLAQEVESMFAAGEPIVTKCSIVLGRRVDSSADSYIDELRGRYGIRVKPLDHRQLSALDETLPCSVKRVNPFLQDVTIPALAYAGLNGFSELGDGAGVYIGLVSPDWSPCYLNPLGAPAANLPPAMLIAGDPGSGKSYLAQQIATQCVLGGIRTFFINPKGFDSLEPFAQLVGGDVVRLSDVEDEAGYFDPFRFCPDPQIAAQIANDFILDVLGSRGAGTGFTPEQEIMLGAGLQDGAASGARCVADALRYVRDDQVRSLVHQQALANPTVRLGIGTVSADGYQSQTGLTLIEFDRPLDFPEKGTPPSEYSRPQRIALAIVRLVTRACLESLSSSGGGAIVVDEAWTFLSSSEGLATLQRLGRLGRSQNILPIFATQRVDDLLREGVDMEGYLSRVFVMKLADEREARAALHLCGLEPTAERITWLRSAGPRRAEEGMPAMPARAMHKDLKNRHAAVVIGPMPPAAHAAFTTNPEERRLLREQSGTGPGA